MVYLVKKLNLQLLGMRQINRVEALRYKAFLFRRSDIVDSYNNCFQARHSA
jgi:hypothetical protein